MFYFFSFSLLNKHCSQSVLSTYLEAARCGTCCVSVNGWSLLFFLQKANIQKPLIWIPHLQDSIPTADLQFKHVFCFCPQTDWCVADPLGPNMKLGLSLATAAFLAALICSIDAQGKCNHLNAVYLHTLSHSVTLTHSSLLSLIISTGC